MQISIGIQVLIGILLVVGSYFIGNINNAILISRLKGRDIRSFGSGNPGTMNMVRMFGKGIGALTLVLDALKGAIPSLLGWFFMGEFLSFGVNRLGLYIGGLCAAIGHIYPVCMKFNGGKGAATIIGVCMTADPVITFLAFWVGILFLLVTKIGSLTSFIIMCPALIIEGIRSSVGFGNPLSFPVSVSCSILVFGLFALTLFAHRYNLVKLFSGNEGRVLLRRVKNKSLTDISNLSYKINIDE